jgi:ABC-type uncharacterized transport system auxiliary subunit
MNCLIWGPAIWLLLVSCAACVSVGIERSYPEKNYFALEVRADGNAANPAGNETLEVLNLRVSPRYGDKNFVYRVSDVAYETDFYNQFLVLPGDLITEEVRKSLANAQLFKHVISSSSQLQPSYVLEGTVNALYGDFRNTNAPTAVLETEFFLNSTIPEKPGIIMQKRYAKSVPLSGRSPEALVKGWNEALEAVLTALVADLESLKL